MIKTSSALHAYVLIRIEMLHIHHNYQIEYFLTISFNQLYRRIHTDFISSY